MKDLEEQKTIKQYLLGQLPEAESERVEKQVLTDPEYKETVSLVEDELMEDFVANELADNEKERFVNHFPTTPDQLQRLGFAEAIHTYFVGSEVATPSSRVTKNSSLPIWKRWAASLNGQGQRSFAARLTAVLVGIMFLGAALVLTSRYLRNQPARDQLAALEKLTRLNDPRYGDDELSKNSPVSRVVVTSDFVRSEEGMSKVSVPHEAKVVQFELPAAQSRYRVVLRTIDGEEVFTLPSVTAKLVDGNRKSILNVPTELLPHADYELTLIGLTENGKTTSPRSYFFRVIR